ncbi:hypothetical protein A3J43_00220 [Candidatus Uhrbacteria bacterium RIFCSPHIGHO2_12_FULL_54_23]|uniref:HEPN domain-containing protein n=3 Tax=Candidatus Uhriibacteriota TaxID=1752732 RepID=A0A1F7UFQ4_9BACT|nr:MAG: hypothetical protein A3J43_00220 [Candidatus Uhrbacteria bacterium RIFCSPHIGHO2_12_FULL_54_23]OGL85512.1 MAG: hypothetical protein A3B36_00860 [Candidatus Uhrbacteria bacterium RIFCSPLOWO2_01_FULL_55_36]OGL89643.1 MAG: hypothetical protein A3J36_02085 [Candidatus Uhrbacteria bacterium RIFCSPLOWO2_02_FULL_54_37]
MKLFLRAKECFRKTLHRQGEHGFADEANRPAEAECSRALAQLTRVFQYATRATRRVEKI